MIKNVQFLRNTSCFLMMTVSLSVQGRTFVAYSEEDLILPRIILIKDNNLSLYIRNRLYFPLETVHGLRKTHPILFWVRFTVNHLLYIKILKSWNIINSYTKCCEDRQNVKLTPIVSKLILEMIQTSKSRTPKINLKKILRNRKDPLAIGQLNKTNFTFDSSKNINRFWKIGSQGENWKSLKKLVKILGG